MTTMPLPRTYVPSPVFARLRRGLHAMRWAPAPRFEGSASNRWRFVGYVAVSMVAWTLIGFGIAAALGAVL